jgi:hypothetical protein
MVFIKEKIMMYVVDSNGTKLKLKQVKVGDQLLCENDTFNTVIDITPFSSHTLRIEVSNLKRYYIPKSMQLKTINGFKFPQIGDIIYINDNYKPVITNIVNTQRIEIHYDIMTDKGTLVNIDNMAFRNTFET